MTDTHNPPADPGALPEIVAGGIRAGLTTLSGVLVSKGVLTSDQTTGFVGAGLFVITVAWSIFQKVQARKRLAAAVAAPQGKTHT